MTVSATREATASLRRNGKSFWFASLFLPRQVASDAARLYAFCRAMDDLADIAVTDESRTALARVREELQNGATSIPAAQDYLDLAKRYALPGDVVDYLIATLIQDSTTELHIEDEAGLVQYCYGAAGTVGLMMAPILGVDRQSASEAAVHLGIAMQMTNIARDVLEDARNRRRYLPGCWVKHLTAQQIAESADAREIVAAAVARLLMLADRYYASAAPGFRWIPSRARNGIEIAGAVYRQIGMELRHNGFAWWKGRARVSLRRKVWITLLVYLGLSPLRRLQSLACDAELSLPLAGLPGAR